MTKEARMTNDKRLCLGVTRRDPGMHVKGGARASYLAIAALGLVAIGTASLAAADPVETRSYEARDTLAAPADPVADAALCLRGLAWTPGPFSVTCSSEPRTAYDALVQFPSPLSSGDAGARRDPDRSRRAGRA